jgi:hypothetical protein
MHSFMGMAQNHATVIPENAEGVYPGSGINLKYRALGTINSGFPLSRE